MKSPRRALFIALFLLVAFLQSPLAIIPIAHCAEGDYTGEHWDTSAQGSNNWGLTTDGEYFWISDYGTDEVYKYFMNGTYTTEHWDTSGQGGNPWGITTDGEYIWTVDYVTDKVYKYFMNGTYTTENWGVTGNAMGITTDGEYIWVSDYVADEIYKYEMDGTYTTDHWDTSAHGTTNYGITNSGLYIWTTCYSTDTVYKYLKDGTYISSWPHSVANREVGIATTGWYIWTLDYLNKEVYKYEGIIVPPDAPTSLFGAGFNGSTPVVDLYWDHNLVNMDFLEIQNSTDKISWDYLGSNTTAEYHDFQVVNGTERYYRVRACNYTAPSWYNSTWSDINFEKVYFVMPIGGVSQPNITQIDKIEFNTTIAGDRCMVTGAFSDVEGLSGYIFWNNATSAPGGVNSSFTALAGTLDYGYENITLPTSGTRMGVKYYVNDTDNNWAMDTLVIFPTILNQTQITYENVTGAWLEYNYTSIITIEGTNVSIPANFLNQTYFPDLIQYNVTETTGAPGLHVNFNITGLPDGLICLSLRHFMSYDGSDGHTFELQAYEYNSSTWVMVLDIWDDAHPCQWMNASLPCEGVWIQDGLFQGRFYHSSPGNINHLWMVDSGHLRGFAPYELVCEEAPALLAMGKYYALAIILLILGVLIGIGMRRRR